MMKKSLAAVAAVILTLLCVEASFRLLGLNGRFFPSRADTVLPGAGGRPAPYGFIPHATIRTYYPEPSARGFSGVVHVVDHHFNSAGWRDREHEMKKPPGTYRILGLGDSYLYGQGVAFEDICLTKLEGMLRQSCPGTAVEAINTGMSNFDTAAERDLLVNRGLAYDPDLVIVFFVLNDVEENIREFDDRPKVEFHMEYLATYMRPDALSRVSHAWAWLRQRVLRDLAGRRYVKKSVELFRRDPSRWRHAWDALLDIRRACDERGVKLLVVVFPFFYHLDRDYPFAPIHERMDASCEKEGIPVLDLLPYYRGFRGPELWVHPMDQHPNRKAHEIAARAIFDYLAEHAAGLFPCAPNAGAAEPVPGAPHAGAGGAPGPP